MEFKCRNVNDAFAMIVEGLHNGEIPTTTKESRNGPVMVIEEPVIICYERPWERVIFNPYRDCNPFFHLYESLWMLAGRNDIAPLNYYCGGRYSNYSDDGTTANGAYGYRWRGEGSHYRHTPYVDQLDVLIKRLQEKPEDRRCVLQMWSVQDDLLKIDTSRDVCCNTNVYFLIREETVEELYSDEETHRYLDMTVCNRSNDLIWGALGANAVHFSFLHEYMAKGIGVEIGRYYQMSNNLHVYTENGSWKPEEYLKEYEGQSEKTRTMWTEPRVDYADDHKHYTLFDRPEERAEFDEEVQDFVEDNFSEEGVEDINIRKYLNPFLNEVAKPMCRAFMSHKLRDYNAAEQWLQQCQATDWRTDGLRWITKRAKNWEKKNNG